MKLSKGIILNSIKRGVTMKIKGKRVVITDEASEFANTMRGQYIISQALTIARGVLMKYEEGNRMDLRYAEPSNRADMEYLLEAFPLYRVHEEAVWLPQENNKE